MKLIFLILLFYSASLSAQTKAFIPKQDQALPDNYGMTIYYVTGKQEVFALASHYYNKETNVIEFWTSEDIHNWVPMSNVLRVEFDKNFSKMIAVKEKLEMKKLQKENVPQK